MKNLLLLIASFSLTANAVLPPKFEAEGVSVNGKSVDLARIDLFPGQIYNVKSSCLAKRTDGAGAAKIATELVLIWEKEGEPVPVVIETVGKSYNPQKYEASLGLDGKTITVYVTGEKNASVRFVCNVEWKVVS